MENDPSIDVLTSQYCVVSADCKSIVTVKKNATALFNLSWKSLVNKSNVPFRNNGSMVFSGTYD